MNISSLEYRFISFGEVSNEMLPQLFWASRSRPPAQTPHQLQVPLEKSAQILMGLEEKARAIEWQTAVSLELTDRAPQEKIQALIRLEPGHALRVLMSGSLDDDQSYPWSSLRTLKANLERIVRRKTIFCMPSSCDAWFDVVERIADEAYSRSMSEQELPYAFVRIASETSKEASPSLRSMMDSFLTALQTRVAEDALKGMPTKKPGPTLLEGETGTGKTFAAKLFHLNSDRREEKYHHVNLAAVNKQLLESRLRGHARGSFTGAIREEKGWFEKAHKGVLFLDELQSADDEFQTQLLDLLNPSTNEVSVAKIGKDEDRPLFDVKVILAVNEPVDTLIRDKRLRRDIFYRIRNIVHLSPLRDRFKADANGSLIKTLLRIYRWKSAPAVSQEEISEILIDEMGRLFPHLLPGALEILLNHDWPGNLREFERVANDLYWDIDEVKFYGNRIDSTTVFHAINAFEIREVPSITKQEVDMSIEDRVRSEVQAALRSHNFVIKHVLPELRRYKLSSHTALKTYLRDNEALLAPDVVADSKMKRLLQRVRERT